MANWKPPPSSHNPPAPSHAPPSPYGDPRSALGYAPPGYGAPHASPEPVNEFSALRPPLAQAASAGVCVAGALVIFSGLQLFMFQRFGYMKTIPYAFLALGMATLVAGWRVFRKTSMGRLIPAIIASGLMTTLSGGWVILALGSGFFSLIFGPFTPIASLAGFILCLTAIPKVQRADALRSEMKARGEDLGL